MTKQLLALEQRERALLSELLTLFTEPDDQERH